MSIKTIGAVLLPALLLVSICGQTFAAPVDAQTRASLKEETARLVTCAVSAATAGISTFSVGACVAASGLNAAAKGVAALPQTARSAFTNTIYIDQPTEAGKIEPKNDTEHVKPYRPTDVMITGQSASDDNTQEQPIAKELAGPRMRLRAPEASTEK